MWRRGLELLSNVSPGFGCESAGSGFVYRQGALSGLFSQRRRWRRGFVSYYFFWQVAPDEADRSYVRGIYIGKEVRLILRQGRGGGGQQNF